MWVGNIIYMRDSQKRNLFHKDYEYSIPRLVRTNYLKLI